MSELDQYDYELPKELIAQFPLRNRADARLMVVDRRRDSIQHRHVRDLPDLIHAEDSLVLNDTLVVPARLAGIRARTSGRWTGLFVSADEQGVWQVMAKTRGRLEPGEEVILHDRAGRAAVSLRMIACGAGGQWRAKPEADQNFLEILDRVGRVPLPPYIRAGEMVDADRSTYQTVYAESPGAVAAPTAGLHFTRDLLNRIEALGVAIARVTLHVGPGTFQPVKAERLDLHVMHHEWGRISATTAARLVARRHAGGRIMAVGTTSMRVLETAARSGELQPWQGETDLFIRPPFAFHATDALLTNFHLPRSTLLVLVRTFGGDSLIRRAYDEAIRDQYRFFSYGDAMLIL